MTELLDRALSRLRERTAAEQDEAAEVLLEFLDGKDPSSDPYVLTPEQIEEVHQAVVDLEAGRLEVLTAEETDAMWRRLGA